MQDADPTLCTLADLKLGEVAIIDSFSNESMALRLIEMGCNPGERVKINNFAPLGDPIAIFVSGYLLSLRKQEALTVLVRPLGVGQD